MGYFKEQQIEQDNELMSAATIIQDILLRLQNGLCLEDTERDVHGGDEEFGYELGLELPQYFEEPREACV